MQTKDGLLKKNKLNCSSNPYVANDKIKNAVNQIAEDEIANHTRNQNVTELVRQRYDLKLFLK